MEPSTLTQTCWFAIQTRYRYEHRVANDLTAKGLENYLPVLNEIHQWKDRKKSVEVPAFGGYLFARFEATQRNRVRVLETTGVVRLLGSALQPEVVPDREIESLRLSLDSGAHCTRHAFLEIGTPLRIQRGPLAGLEGRLVRSANALRLVVCIASVGQAIAVEVAREDVIPIEASYQVRFHQRESGMCEVIDFPVHASQASSELRLHLGADKLLSM
jgi:transcription antitermination factor NusG